MIALDTFDIRSYFYYVNVPYWEAGKNVSHGWLGIRCIYCSDHHNHLGINLIHWNFTCWLCKQRGDVLQLIQDIEGINFHAARERIEEFQELYPYEITEQEHLEDVGQDILPEGCSEELTPGQKTYLRGRRFAPRTLVKTWGVLSGPMMGRWRYRIIIPIEVKGRALSFIGLDHTGDRDVKYLAASTSESILPTKALLYGADHVHRSVVVVEGVTDAWRIGPGAVATLGMGVTPKQVDSLLKLDADHYHIMFDGESLAIANAHKLGRELRMAGKDVEVIELDDGDPGDLPDDEAEAIRKEYGLD